MTSRSTDSTFGLPVGYHGSPSNKSSIIKDFVVDHNVDVLALTETWIRSDNSDQRIINDLCPNGYLFKHIPRKTKGGGVALLYKLNFKVKNTTTTKSYKSFELADYVIHYSPRKLLRMIVIYRPPPSTSNALTLNLFFDEFSQFLESTTTITQPMLICGDFNFHLDVNEDRSAQRFSDLLDIFNLQQHVKGETHKSGHTLDLIITRSDESSLVSNIQITDPVISDHFAVHCALSISKPSYPRKEISYRQISKIDREKFNNDIINSPLTNFSQTNNVEELSDLYDGTLTTLLDQHAPIKRRTITLRPAAPWYTDNIKTEKTKRRRLECQWRKN
ncbi:MAG: hypothetical protein DSY43_06485 [Gammaproteobacteria bacterium]|nr:MAG: hypothetical protein DSY43_06485 [Gammaproteobacteria bacterium]